MRSTRWTIMITVIGVLVSCATLPDNVQRKVSTAYPDTHDTRIGQRVQTEMQMHPGESGYLLFGNGQDAFMARLLLAQLAEWSIDTQYYMIHDDVVGQSKSSLHAKCFLLDRETAFIGSLNLDSRSVVQNTEIGGVFKSPPIAGHIANEYDRQIDHVAFRLELRKARNGSERLLWHGLVDGDNQTFDHDPCTGFWKRFGIGFMRLLPIESQI